MSFLDSADDDPKRAARRPLLFFVLVTLVGGRVGASVFTEPNIPTWYAGLVHPSFAPPNWLFAPVWTTLYVLMAVAAWRVWRVTGTKSPEMAAYVVATGFQFRLERDLLRGLHQIGLALVEIGVLLAADPGHHHPVLAARPACGMAVPALSGLDGFRGFPELCLLAP